MQKLIVNILLGAVIFIAGIACGITIEQLDHTIPTGKQTYKPFVYDDGSVIIRTEQQYVTNCREGIIIRSE